MIIIQLYYKWWPIHYFFVYQETKQTITAPMYINWQIIVAVISTKTKIMNVNKGNKAEQKWSCFMLEQVKNNLFKSGTYMMSIALTITFR